MRPEDELLMRYLSKLEVKQPLTRTEINNGLTRNFSTNERVNVLRKAILKKLIQEQINLSTGRGRPMSLYSLTEKGKIFFEANIKNGG